ncbi:hypothetical protein OAU51_01040 [Porticoccaceae bacterium]|jgi:hypothetical protein|nr:hypothetical protein [Porticoccaceae bacterium]
MQALKLETADRMLISAFDLEENFDTGLSNFKALLRTVDVHEKDRLIDIMETIINDISASRQ